MAERVDPVEAPTSGTGPQDSQPLGAAADVAREFVQAVAWGEHLRVWQLMGEEGHRAVLRVAVKRGMDESLSVRIGAGSATRAETDGFLADLVNGLRADLAGTDLEALSFWADPAVTGPARAWVVMMAPLPSALGGDVPAGTLDLSCAEGHWRVERIIPRPSRARSR